MSEPVNIFQLFMPGVMGHVEDPETELPYFQMIKVYGQDFDILQRELIRICMWNKDNLSGANWYINSDLLTGDFDAMFKFNFSTEEDLMAFKLRWL